MNDYCFYNKSDNPFSVEETYLYFINELMCKLLVKNSIISKKTWIFSTPKKVIKSISKEDIENKYFRTHYKLDIYSIETHRKLGNIYYKLSQFLKEKNYYYIDSKILVLHYEYFSSCIQATFSNYSNYSQNWFEKEKKEIEIILTGIQTKEKKKLSIEGFLYAKIFLFLESIIYEFEDSFNNNNLYFKELVQDLFNLINEYNEQQFVEALIKTGRF